MLTNVGSLVGVCDCEARIEVREEYCNDNDMIAEDSRCLPRLVGLFVSIGKQYQQDVCIDKFVKWQ
jgi:hypothetical protein